MKKLKILALMLLCGAASVSAQDIQGTIVDGQHLPIPYSTVSVLKADSTFIVGVVTDDNGRFQLPANEEARIVKASSVGYNDLAVSLPLASDTLVMQQNEKMLDAVQVVAQRQVITNEVDRISYDMQADPESQTKNVMDMLRKVPLVAVDGQENITVNGSSAFKIYKNGHPDNSLGTNAKDVLKAIPASMIKKIEVITEPGAKYDAEGVTAILNIVMVDNSAIKGVTATLSGRFNQYLDSQLSGYVTAQTGKLITSVNYGYVEMGDKVQRQGNESETTYVETGYRDVSSSQSRFSGKVHFADIEASYELDSLNLITASGGGYLYDIDVNGTSSQAQYDAVGNLLYSYNASHYMPKYSYSEWHGRADYEHRTHRKNEVFTLSYMLSTTRSKNDQNMTFFDMVNMPVAYSGYQQKRHEQFYEHTAQADYVRPFGEYHKLDMGAKYIYRLNKSQTSMHYDGTTDPMNSLFDHNTQVAAAYLQYMYHRGKLSAQLGLRYEYSLLEAKYKDGSGADYDTHLSDLVPSFNLAWQFNPANSLKLTYSTSINRPGIGYLNPARVETVRSVSYGNSQLESSRNQSLGLTFMHIGQKLTYNIRPYFRYVNNGIGRWEWVENNINYTTFGNLLKRHDGGLSGYVQLMPWQGTTIMLNAGVSYEHQKNPSLGLSMHGWSSDVWSNVTQQLPWKIRLTLGGGGNIGRDVNDIYSRGGGWKYYYGNLSRSFLKEDRLTVSLQGQNLFDKNSHWKSYTVQGDTRGWSRGTNHSRQIGISISYRLGKLNASVKKTQATIENSDVEGGIQKAQ